MPRGWVSGRKRKPSVKRSLGVSRSWIGRNRNQLSNKITLRFDNEEMRRLKEKSEVGKMNLTAWAKSTLLMAEKNILDIPTNRGMGG